MSLRISLNQQVRGSSLRSITFTCQKSLLTPEALLYLNLDFHSGNLPAFVKH